MIKDRPLPEPDADSQPFWDGCRRGVLQMQRCAACKRFRFYPRPTCPHCRSFDSEWVETSGRGKIYSWIVAHAPVMPAFQDQVPMAVVLVELEEDPELRLVGNIRECANQDLRFDLPVEVVFEQVADDVVLPQWRPRR
jgi:hypothetical protein